MMSREEVNGDASYEIFWPKRHAQNNQGMQGYHNVHHAGRNRPVQANQ
jgi:hypothetical protein